MIHYSGYIIRHKNQFLSMNENEDWCFTTSIRLVHFFLTELGAIEWLREQDMEGYKVEFMSYQISNIREGKY